MDASVSTRPYTFCATSIGYVVGQDDGQREWARNAGMRFLITNRLMRGRGVVFFIIAENAFMRMYEARSISVGPQNFSALLQLWLLFAWVCAILYGGYRGVIVFGFGNQGVIVSVSLAVKMRRKHSHSTKAVFGRLLMPYGREFLVAECSRGASRGRVLAWRDDDISLAVPSESRQVYCILWC